MARLFVTVASFVAACATVNAFQVPRMSLDKYRSELAETAKKIASPGTFFGAWIDRREGRGGQERSGFVVVELCLCVLCVLMSHVRSLGKGLLSLVVFVAMAAVPRGGGRFSGCQKPAGLFPISVFPFY